MTVVFGCDNAGVEIKDLIKKNFVARNIQVEDIGCFTSADDTFYPVIAKQVCNRIIESGYNKRGILICGTGIGMCMTANKFKGIRAAVAHDGFSAQRSILSNNANVLCMGARVIGPELAKMIALDWVDYQFQDGASTPKIQAMIQTEMENFR